MMISLTVSEMEKVPGRPAAGHPVLMMLDEFSALKRMPVIENALDRIAGFGVKMCFVLQSLSQLKDILGRVKVSDFLFEVGRALEGDQIGD